MVDCRKCGELIPEGKNFCANCGEKVVSIQGGMKYEEYDLRKNSYTAASMFYLGVMFLSMGILLLFPGIMSSATYLGVVNFVAIIVILLGMVMIFAGGFWSMHLDRHLSGRLTDEYMRSRRE